MTKHEYYVTQTIIEQRHPEFFSIPSLFVRILTVSGGVFLTTLVKSVSNVLSGNTTWEPLNTLVFLFFILLCVFVSYFVFPEHGGSIILHRRDKYQKYKHLTKLLKQYYIENKTVDDFWNDASLGDLFPLIIKK